MVSALGWSGWGWCDAFSQGSTVLANRRDGGAAFLPKRRNKNAKAGRERRKAKRRGESGRDVGQNRTDKEIRPHVLIINCCENVVETCNEQYHLVGLTLNSQVSVNSLYTD